MPTSAPAIPQSDAAPGRPREIEEATNRYLVHPLSRRLVDALVRTKVTPNQVSAVSVLFAAAGALCYWALAWPWAALAGVTFWFAWHVLDGADGDLARRTGRASPVGELVDGVCDHLSQALLYIVFAAILQRQVGPWAWALAVVSALSHFVQANAYETGRKTYRRWVYGAAWMAQSHEGAAGVRRLLGGLYLTLSSALSPGEDAVAAAMAPRLAAGGALAAAAAERYRDLFAPLIRRGTWLGGNTRTIAAFTAMLVGGPLWFFAFEIVALNLALIALIAARARRNRELTGALTNGGAIGGYQAAAAPN